MLLSIATPYLVGFIVEGVLAALLIAGIVVTIVVRRRRRAQAQPALPAPPVLLPGSGETEYFEPAESDAEHALALLPEEALDEEDDEDADEADEDLEIIVGGKKIFARYSRSFLAKLMQVSDGAKAYYAELANYLLSHKNVKNRISWAFSSFNCGRQKIAKLNIRGKTLWLYLALDPKEFENTKYFVKDVSDKKKYEAVPCMVKVRSARGVKFAKELIDILSEQAQLVKLEAPKTPVDAAEYPYDTMKNLIERGLVKVKDAEGRELTDRIEKICVRSEGK